MYVWEADVFHSLTNVSVLTLIFNLPLLTHKDQCLCVCVSPCLSPVVVLPSQLKLNYTTITLMIISCHTGNNKAFFRCFLLIVCLL